MGGFGGEGVGVEIRIISGGYERFEQSGGVGDWWKIGRVDDGAESGSRRTVNRGGRDPT